MAEYNVVIRQDDEYQVWLDASDSEEPDANAMVLGSGDTRDAALKAAREELVSALNRVDIALKRSVEVLQ